MAEGRAAKVPRQSHQSVATGCPDDTCDTESALSPSADSGFRAEAGLGLRHIEEAVVGPILERLAELKRDLHDIADSQVDLRGLLTVRTLSKQRAGKSSSNIPEINELHQCIPQENVELGPHQHHHGPLMRAPMDCAMQQCPGMVQCTEVTSMIRHTSPCPSAVSYTRQISPTSPVSSSGKRRGPRIFLSSSSSKAPSRSVSHDENNKVAFFDTVPTDSCSEHSTPSEPRPRLLSKRSKSNFEAFRTEDEDKADLKALFELAEIDQSEEVDQKPLLERLRSITAQHVEMTLDSVIGLFIVLNAIFIGFSMDATEQQQGLVFTIDISFSVVFIFELMTKLKMHGFRGQFLGSNRFMNMFDAGLIFIDLVQLVLQIVYPSAASNVADLPSASLFRIVRLARLIRILRLLRHPALQTLLMMLHGMFGGLPTLCWALLLFISTVYVVALMFREFLGRAEHQRIYEYFFNVPRAMVTTFRCSFGDCTTIQGTPIFEHVDEVYGMGFSLFYCLFAFAMSIGMFNVISAIFVQSTMAAATALQNKNKKERLQNESLWASRVTVLVKAVLEACYPWRDDITDLSKEVDDIYELKVETNILERLGNCPIVIEALEDLDVDPEDHTHLADILDVEQSGNIAIIELLQGIKRLRGNPRRSDIVAIDLTCRAMQNTLKQIQGILEVDNIRKNSKMSVDTSKRSTAD
eukprot:TRINITY_DN10770_c0_g2_i1.p1 TRINITY_DN10770_c0_g2~~TRINITY_DN10770_c0_g2_i1.p1  ORF type:complete len:694 (+),score=131.89 TRINITY_DN10770_c0_g2_i1:132-2213(+)